MLFSVFVLLASISYLFSWRIDQSVLDNNFSDFVFDFKNISSSNFMGKLGAYCAHFFIYNGFGIGSFLIYPMFFILGYNLYRKDPDNDSYKVLNEDIPIKEDSYQDTFFEFGKRYSFFVRTVSLGADGQPVESLPSNTVSITPKDTFAPAPPDSITIAAAPNNISIFFATNVEKDVIGYKVYRSTNPNLPKDKWQTVTPELLKTNTFQDTKTVSAVVYYYYITALDNAGNVSEPSEVVSETAF